MEQTNREYFEEAADQELPQGEYVAEVAKAHATLERSKTNSSLDESELEGTLTVDVYQTPSAIVVESAIAGVAPEDIDVDVTRDSIAIRGMRHREKRVKN